MRKKRFDLKVHVEDHADYFFDSESKKELNYIDDYNLFEFKDYQDYQEEKEDSKMSNNNYIHFVASFDLGQFKDKEEAKQKLKILLKELLRYEMIVEEKNGKRKLKNGKVVQKTRKRRIKIGEFLTAGAIHTRGFDSLWAVNPHLHLLFSKKARLGKNFIYLKKAITEIIKNKNLNIKPSFSEKEGLISKSFKKVLNARSWAIRQGRNINLNTVEKFVKDIVTYLERTNNLEFAIKQYILLKKKLNISSSKISELESAIFLFLEQAYEDEKNNKNTKLARFRAKNTKFRLNLIQEYYELSGNFILTKEYAEYIPSTFNKEKKSKGISF